MGDVPHVLAVCGASEELVVTPEDDGEWSVTLVDTPSSFVDVYSSDDIYPAELWKEAAAYFASAPEEDMTLPGGRYSCAHALLSRHLPFFKGRSLGQLNHIVQLAMTDKKLLGYLNGAVVPYGRSQSMVKERSASHNQALENPCLEAASLPCATLQQTQSCLRTILEEAASNQGQGPGQIALSNVKRMFRSQFELELSETTLGHSRLTDLLRDQSFRSVCHVQLEKHGYTIVQVVEPEQPNLAYCAAGFCADEPLCLLDAEEPSDIAAFGPTPGPFGPTPQCASFVFESGQVLRTEDVDTSGDLLPFGPNSASTFLAEHCVNNTVIHDEGSYLKQILHDYLGQAQSVIQEDEANPRQFCPHEPLCFEAADRSLNVLGFGPTPGPFGWSPSPQHTRPVAVPPLPSLSPWKDGRLDNMVQRTFIHADSPAKALAFGSLRRSSSMGDLSESTSARSVSRKDSEASHDFEDSPWYQDISCQLVVSDGNDSIPPTPMMWVPSTPFTPLGLDHSVQLLQQPCGELPILSLSHLVA